MITQTLGCWAQALLLDDHDLKFAAPKTLRYRLWHGAGRIVHHARRMIVRLDRTWAWASELADAFTRLRAQHKQRPASRRAFVMGSRSAAS
jgi:hypothetical protein